VPIEHRLTVQVGAAPLADRHWPCEPEYMYFSSCCSVSPQFVCALSVAPHPQPLRHVLHRACIGGRRKQRLDCVTPHFISAHVKRLKRRR
jgi:hypothetical protein